VRETNPHLQSGASLWAGPRWKWLLMGGRNYRANVQPINFTHTHTHTHTHMQTDRRQRQKLQNSLSLSLSQTHTRLSCFHHFASSGTFPLGSLSGLHDCTL